MPLQSQSMNAEEVVFRAQLNWYRSTMVPVTIVVFAISLHPVLAGNALGPVHKVLLLSACADIVHMLINQLALSLEFRKAKERAKIGERFLIFFRTALYLMIWGYDGESQDVLLKGLSVILLPMATARATVWGSYLKAYLLVHFAMTLVRFGSLDLTAEGWQWLAISSIHLAFLGELLAVKSEGIFAVASMESTYQGFRRLLSMICDGYLVLDDRGCVMGFDTKAASLFGFDALHARRWAGEPLEAFSTIGGDAPSREPEPVSEGLRTMTFAESDGAFLRAELYIVRWMIPDDSLDRIVGRGQHVKTSNARYLCAIRAIQNLDKSRQPIQQDSQQAGGQEGPRSLKSVPAAGEAHDMRMQDLRMHLDTAGASQLTSDVKFERPGEPEKKEENRARAVDSPPGSPRSEVTDAAAAGAGGAFAFPGGPWRAVPVSVGSAEYKKVRMVAKGSQGAVFEVKREGERLALKEVPLKGVLWQRDLPRLLHNVDREVRILKSLQWASPVIVSLRDCWLQSDFTLACIVMEWLPLTLVKVLQSHRSKGKGRVATVDAVRWTAQMSAGVAAIHYAGFLHRDIKAANVLLTADQQHIKLADLGLSRPLHRVPPKGQQDMMSETGSMATSVSGISVLSGFTENVGTQIYSSPEEMGGGTYYSCPSDVFSLGCVVLELMTLASIADVRKESQAASKSVSNYAGRLLDEAAPAPGSEESADYTTLAGLNLLMLSEASDDRPAADDLVCAPMLRPHVEALAAQSPQLVSNILD